MTRRAAAVTVRAAARAARIEWRARAKVLHRTRLVVRGALCSAELPDACGRLLDVLFEREPDTSTTNGATLGMSLDRCEVRYVPRADAIRIASLLDHGAAVEATVDKLWRTRGGKTVPIVVGR
jgi:hypothetical protein